MAHFLKPVGNRTSGPSVRISKTIQNANVNANVLFGLWGPGKGWKIGPNDPSAAEYQPTGTESDVLWFYLVPKRTGHVMIECRDEAGNVLDYFQLAMRPPVPGSGRKTPSWFYPSITPSQYVEAYKTIAVQTAGGGRTVVELNTYRCALGIYGGLGDALPFLESCRNAARVSGTKKELETLMKESSTLVFWGKGSPETLGEALSAIDRCVANPKALAGFGNFRGDVERSDRLQHICDTFLGVDCNGFVGHYARRVGVPGADPQLAPTYWRNIGPRELRANADEIARGDVIIWPGGVHIALVDLVVIEGARLFLNVAMATGPGGPQLTSMHPVTGSAAKTAEPVFDFGAGTPPSSMLPRNGLVVKSIGLA